MRDRPADDLRSEIRQGQPFAHPREEAVLSLLRSSHQVEQQLSRFLRHWQLTPTRYNALRILRGAGSEGLPCGEVGERMVTPVPDVTRLLDRLEKRGWVERRRDPEDRRVVRVTLTPRAEELLGRVDGPLGEWLAAALAPLGDEKTLQLVSLLAEVRGALRARSRALQ